MPRVDRGIEFDELSRCVIGCAINVHKELGPGLLESAYHLCLLYELQQSGLRVKYKHPIPLQYGAVIIDKVYEADLIVEDELLLELKAVDALDNLMIAQVITYLKLLKLPRALLINFNVTLLRQGIKRIVM